jgi:hypothetical protein
VARASIAMMFFFFAYQKCRQAAACRRLSVTWNQAMANSFSQFGIKPIRFACPARGRIARLEGRS